MTGNIMALIDVLCDIIAIVTDKTASGIEKFFNWVSLGINLIGVIPLRLRRHTLRMGSAWQLEPTAAQR